MARKRRGGPKYTEDALRKKASEHKLQFHRRSLTVGYIVVSVPPDPELYTINQDTLMDAEPGSVIGHE